MPVNNGNNEIDYQIVETEFFDTTYIHTGSKEITSFRNRIIGLLNNGYTPVGGINVVCKPHNSYIRYVQALIKQN